MSYAWLVCGGTESRLLNAGLQGHHKTICWSGQDSNRSEHLLLLVSSSQIDQLRAPYPLALDEDCIGPLAVRCRTVTLGLVTASIECDAKSSEGGSIGFSQVPQSPLKTFTRAPAVVVRARPRRQPALQEVIVVEPIRLPSTTGTCSDSYSGVTQGCVHAATACMRSVHVNQLAFLGGPMCTELPV